MQNYPPLKTPAWRKNFLTYLVFLAIIASFGIGLAVGENIIQKKYTGVASADSLKENTNLDLVFEAWKKLNEKYVGTLPEEKNMVYGMTKGMTAALGDPYTTFFEPEKAKQFQENLQGSFGGIGAELGKKDDILTIIAPIEGTPADKAGLRPGDKILKINDKDSSSFEIDEAVSNIRGEKNTKVKLSIISDGDVAPRDVEITRDTIDVKSVKWEMKNDDVAYIRLSQFSEDTVKEFAGVAKEVLESKAKKIVLDLRSNPGGYLESATNIASFFLPEKTLVVKEDFGGKKPSNEYETSYAPTLDKYPLIILIDQGSASASEILAGALSEQKGAKLIGEKTFGKGSVQEVINLEDGSTIKITVAKWFTPKGKTIDKEGITPDEEVKITPEDIKNQHDTQLEKALEEAKGM